MKLNELMVRIWKAKDSDPSEYHKLISEYLEPLPDDFDNNCPECKYLGIYRRNSSRYGDIVIGVWTSDGTMVGVNISDFRN